jgi:hypothetical protein
VLKWIDVDLMVNRLEWVGLTMTWLAIKGQGWAGRWQQPCLRLRRELRLSTEPDESWLLVGGAASSREAFPGSIPCHVTFCPNLEIVTQERL